MSESTTLKTRSGESLTARALAPGDTAALQRFHESLSDESRSTFTPHAYDSETIGLYIERSQSGKDLIYILVTKNEEIIGYFFLWEFRTPVPLLGIGLTDAYQGEGLGEPMMTILIDAARKAGRDGIELTTMPHNERAFRLYLKMGFQYLGDVENVTGDGRAVVERKLFLPLKDGAKPTDRAFEPPV